MKRTTASLKPMLASEAVREAARALIEAVREESAGRALNPRSYEKAIRDLERLRGRPLLYSMLTGGAGKGRVVWEQPPDGTLELFIARDIAGQRGSRSGGGEGQDGQSQQRGSRSRDANGQWVQVHGFSSHGISRNQKGSWVFRWIRARAALPTRRMASTNAAVRMSISNSLATSRTDS